MELKNFSWWSSDLTSGAENVTYKFQYQISVANPFYIFYALADKKAVDTSSLGNPIDANQVQVLLNGTAVDFDGSGTNSFNYNNGLCLKLKNKWVEAGSTVEVILRGVKNKKIPGKYRWKWITTANHQGEPLEQVSNGRKIIHLI